MKEKLELFLASLNNAKAINQKFADIAKTNGNEQQYFYYSGQTKAFELCINRIEEILK